VTNGAQILTLGYSYVNDAGYGNTGTVMISYRAMSDNSVLAATSPASPFSIPSGTSTTVLVSFTTNDGNPATGLTVSPVASAPGDWTLPGPMSCATVDGSATTCQFSLTYAPLSPESGTLQLGYSYINNAGHAASGILNIQYSAS
jgi:hypothetical protein